jgi:hypothetical protein
LKVNGIVPGPNSPLRGKGDAAVIYTAPEFSVQAGLIELLVGRIGKGDRIPGAGLTGRIPSLILIHAIPNGASASSKTEGAKRKREGQLRGMPDLHWPVMRGPFIGLYLETKRKDAKARARQAEVHTMLRAEGHAVVVYDTVQGGLDVVLAYHGLGGNRPSVRPITGQWPKGTPLIEVWDQWRTAAAGILYDKAGLR